MSDVKRYVFDKASGVSKPSGLKLVMEAAARSIKAGHGPFVVIRGGKYHHPGLNRTQALAMVRECARTIPIDSGVVARDNKDVQVFHVKRVGLPPYMDPFRDAHITAERIDAGVDYCGSGPVYPIGNAIITQVGVPSHTSTFGNELSVYQLLDGPAHGKFVFFAEHYNIPRHFSVGEHVSTDTVLYDMNDCIEIGWSDGNGSMAWDINSNIEGQRTAWGQNMSDLLESLGTPPGLVLGRALTMTLPRDWPKWDA